MSRKTSHARVEAFFRALGETGNQTIAAERARVSRSWVSLRQSTDPDFRARMAATVEAAKVRLRERATGVGPDAKWRAQDGEELVVRGTNGRRTQIARARLKQWTPRAEARFLAALAATCNVKAACAAVGLSLASAYNHYHRWEGFAKRWDAALETGYDRLEMALIENAQRSLGVAPDYPPDIPLQPMTFDEALRLLRLHTARVRGGRYRRGADQRGPISSDEVLRELRKRLAGKRRAISADISGLGDVARRDLDRGGQVVRGK